MGKLVNPFASHAKDPQFEPGWNHFENGNILTKKLNSNFVSFAPFLPSFERYLAFALFVIKYCTVFLYALI